MFMPLAVGAYSLQLLFLHFLIFHLSMARLSILSLWIWSEPGANRGGSIELAHGRGQPPDRAQGACR